MPIRIGVQAQGERPFTPLTSIHLSPFSSQFYEIKDLERLHSESPSISTSPTSTPSDPITLSTNPHQLQNAASAAPSSSTIDLTPTPDEYIFARNSHLNPPHRTEQAACAMDDLFPRRHRHSYTLRQIMHERPSPHADIGRLGSVASQQLRLPVEPLDSNLRRPTNSTAHRDSVDGIPNIMFTTSSDRSDPNPRRCTVYALQVQKGDVLKYGNEVNDGCKVTAMYPDDREDAPVLVDDEDDDDGSGGGSGSSARSEDSEGNGGNPTEGRETVLQPVRLNGIVRIEWEDKDGGRSSQLFEGLEKLEVLRGDGNEEEEGEGSEMPFVGPVQQDWIGDW